MTEYLQHVVEVVVLAICCRLDEVFFFASFLFCTSFDFACLLFAISAADVMRRCLSIDFQLFYLVQMRRMIKLLICNEVFVLAKLKASAEQQPFWPACVDVAAAAAAV